MVFCRVTWNRPFCWLFALPNGYSLLNGRKVFNLNLQIRFNFFPPRITDNSVEQMTLQGHTFFRKMIIFHSWIVGGDHEYSQKTLLNSSVVVDLLGLSQEELQNQLCRTKPNPVPSIDAIHRGGNANERSGIIKKIGNTPGVALA